MTFVPNRFGTAVVLSLATLAGCGGSGMDAKSAADEAGGRNSPATVGKPAPDLSLQSLNGKGKISLDALQGKVVVVDFWATWCAPCKQSFPKLEELSKKVGDKAEIIGVSVDDEKSGVAEFAKENGATFAIGWDENHEIAGRWKVGTMPTTFIVDATGTVRHIHDGYHDGETLLMEKEIFALTGDGSSSVRVAASDTHEAKTEPKSEPKDEPKPEGKSEGNTETLATTASDVEKPEAAPPPKNPKKKGGKKGGGGKAAPKRHHKKK